MSEQRILSVGQCAPDHNMLVYRLKQRFEAKVIRADTFDEALEALRSEPFALVLVNRVSDADGTLGLELIRTLKTDPSLSNVPVMLVSDRPSAQTEAVSLGALPGVGKRELSNPKALDRIAEALAAST
jgi:two-component system, chemotaxis family, chemotaxis protein CheY